MPKQIKAVIFDLDGTLVYLKLNYMAIRYEAIKALAKMGFPESMFSLEESIFQTLKKVEALMCKNKGEKRKVRRTVLSITEKYEMDAARMTSVFPGVNATLKKLRKMKIKLAICTVNGRKATNHVLRKFHLGRFFTVVTTRESTSEVKPSPVHLQLVLNKLGVQPEEAVVVGDGVWDIQAAKALGVIGIGVTTGRASFRQLRDAGADYIISSLAELPDLIEQMTRS